MHCPLKKHGATIDWSSSQALEPAVVVFVGVCFIGGSSTLDWHLAFFLDHFPNSTGQESRWLLNENLTPLPPMQHLQEIGTVVNYKGDKNS